MMWYYQQNAVQQVEKVIQLAVVEAVVASDQVCCTETTTSG